MQEYTSQTNGVIENLCHFSNGGDLAVIELEKYLPPFNLRVNRVCLPALDEEKLGIGEELIVAGWPKTKHTEGKPLLLKVY